MFSKSFFNSNSQRFDLTRNTHKMKTKHLNNLRSYGNIKDKKQLKHKWIMAQGIELLIFNPDI